MYKNNLICCHGLTLIEVIMVIILVGILAAYAIPNLNLDKFRAQGFEQQAMATIRYGQKQAIGSGCNFNVLITASACTVQYGAPVETGCPPASTTVVNPATGQSDFCDSSQPDSSAVLPATIQFDKIGRPGGALSINLGSTTITIESETGFAHE